MYMVVSPQPMGTIGLHFVTVTLVFRTWLCFQISERNLVASFDMKSYTSSSTFFMVDSFLVHLRRRLLRVSALLPLRVFRLSVVVNFSHFRLLL